MGLPSSRWSGGSLRVGFGPIRHIERRFRVILAAGLTPRPHGLEIEHAAGTSRGFASQGPGGNAARQFPCEGAAFWSPPGHESSTQTRSTRAPHVARSSQGRSEDRNLTPPSDRSLTTTRLPSPPEPATGVLATMKSHATACRTRGPAVRAACAARSPRLSHQRWGAAMDRAHDPCPLAQVEPVSARSRITALSRREPQGPRAASPTAPRRALGSAAPEVPSIDGPPWAEHGTFVLCRTARGELSTVFHQTVESTERPSSPSPVGSLDGLP